MVGWQKVKQVVADRAESREEALFHGSVPSAGRALRLSRAPTKVMAEEAPEQAPPAEAAPPPQPPPADADPAAAAAAAAAAARPRPEFMREGTMTSSAMQRSSSDASVMQAPANAAPTSAWYSNPDKWTTEGLSVEELRQALQRQLLFKGVGDDLIRALVMRAQRMEVAEGQPVEMMDGKPMYLIERGAIQVVVGPGPGVIFGPGTVLNIVGMLNLCQEAEPFRPRPGMVPRDNATAAAGMHFAGVYEAYSQGRMAPAIFAERRRNGLGPPVDSGQATIDDINCFYCLCPTAAARASSVVKSEGWLTLKVVGAPAGHVPTIPSPAASAGGEGSDVASEPDVDGFPGGATLRAIPLRVIEELGTAVGRLTPETSLMRMYLTAFRSNRQALSDRWRTIMSRCSVLFPGVPAEVLWHIAEGSERRSAEVGEAFVQEGESGEAGEALILMDEGEAAIEKMVGVGGGLTKIVPIGRVGPGAIIGDLGLLGTGVVRAATARARTMVEVLVMPAPMLLSVVRRFPGFLACMEHRLKEVGAFLQNRLPLRVETLISMELFADCDYHFCAEIAGNGERRLFYAGQALRVDAGTFYVVEHGTCVAETPAKGQFLEIGPCRHFGGRTLLGTSTTEGAGVRVISPFAVVLVIKEKWLKEAISRHFGTGRSPFNPDQIMPQGRSLCHYLAPVEVFEGRDKSLLQGLCASAKCCGYMPGQTLAVDGGKDTRLVVVVGGTAEMDPPPGRVVQEPVTVSVFGELAMLGTAHQHVATIRAQSFCFTIEVHRTAFLSILEHHPEERERFERFAVRAIQSGSKEVQVARWPFLPPKAPPRLLYLLDLYAGRYTFRANDQTLRDICANQKASLLVLQGKARVLDADGVEVDRLEAGHIFNEQALLASAFDVEEEVIPITDCEIQILPVETWKKVISEFPRELETVRRGILQCMAERGARICGVALNSPEVLRMSGLMRTVSAEFVEWLAPYLESQVFMPGQPIVHSGHRGDQLLIFLSGVGRVEDHTKRLVEFKKGSVLGEAMLLGITLLHPNTVKAYTLATLQCLRKRYFQEALQKFDRDREQLSLVLREAKTQAGERLPQKLARTGAFAQAAPDFLEVICEHAVDAFYSPGDEVISLGTECKYGETPLFVLLAGKAMIENDKGVLQNMLGPGEQFGEGGALGLAARRGVAVRATGRGTVHCAMLVGPSLEAAFQQFPEEREPFEHVLEHRMEANKAFVARRTQWLVKIAIPALAQVPIFAGQPDSFFLALSATLNETVHKAGELVSVCGEAADTMLVVLEGVLEAETPTGEQLGRIMDGASIGEVTVLRLYDARLANVRAVCRTRLLPVPAAALQAVLDADDAARAHFQRLKASRQDQVAKCLPMSALQIGISKDCVCGRAIALQAERFHLKPGTLWHPLPDDHPCGPHFFIFVRGHAIVEIIMPEDQPAGRSAVFRDGAVSVMPLSTAFYISEGVAAEYNLRIRAIAPCEAYRVREFDFDAALASAASAASVWLTRFRMVEAESTQQLRARAECARGVMEGLLPHPNDPDIHSWRERKTLACDRAEEKATLLGRLPNVWNSPRIPPPRTGSPASRPSGSGLTSKSASRQGVRSLMSKSTPDLRRSKVVVRNRFGDLDVASRQSHKQKAPGPGPGPRTPQTAAAADLLPPERAGSPGGLRLPRLPSAE